MGYLFLEHYLIFKVMLNKPKQNQETELKKLIQLLEICFVIFHLKLPVFWDFIFLKCRLSVISIIELL